MKVESGLSPGGGESGRLCQPCPSQEPLGRTAVEGGGGGEAGPALE